MNDSLSADIIVIGGGAAGMMAAGVAAESGARVILLEKNAKLGKKLCITGKGRCNLTNNCSTAEIIDNIPTGGKFLYSAINTFPPVEVMAFFESLGVRLKTERGGRVFPQSDKAQDVAGALRNYLYKNKVEIKSGAARLIDVKDGKVRGVTATDGFLSCNCVILATGGASYPATGSTGDGYKIASKLGHTVTPVRGSLVPLEAEGEACKQMQGLTLKNVQLSVTDGKARPIYEDFGELIFTHFGLSGPLVLSASAHMREFDGKKYRIHINLKPALDEKTLDERILRDFKKYTNYDFINALSDLLPRLCIPVIIDRAKIDPRQKVHSVTREQRRELVKNIRDFTFDIVRPRPVEEAIITSGGVELKEINPKTMESKLIGGLYFAGEIIDADAYTGGFNLQIAWSTGYVAGKAAANRR